MKEALKNRVKLINDLTIMCHSLVQEIEPGTPTKALEAAGLLKQALQVLGNRLGDPEPDAVTIEQSQKVLALMRIGDVALRSKSLFNVLERTEQVLLADHAGSPILTWTAEEKAQAQQHVQAAGIELKQAIEELPPAN